MPERMHNPERPSELLREFMGNHSATELAEHIGVARATISRIVGYLSSMLMFVIAFALVPIYLFRLW